MPQKRRRLSRSAEFDRVYRRGTSAASRYLVLYAFPRERAEDVGSGEPQGQPPGDDDYGARLGVSVGRKVGGAVVRNRVKRLLREAFWSLVSELPRNRDYVIMARAEAATLAEREGANGFVRELRQLALRLGGDAQGGADAGSA